MDGQYNKNRGEQSSRFFISSDKLYLAISKIFEKISGWF
jgi:hypothetical protein